MSSISRKDSSWSFDSEKWPNEGKNEPHSAVYAVHVKEELQKGMHQHRGVACCVMLKVGGHQVVYFVTSSDLETDKKQADLLPCIAQKTEGCQLVVDSSVKFGPFAFLSFDRKSSPGLKGNPLTCLDFQVPKQNLKSEFEARTFVGTKKLLKLKFEYQRDTRKYSFSAKKKDRLEQSFVLGAPIIIKNKDVTDKRSSSRWPVVGVMGLDEDREFFPYFVTADIFDRKPVHSKGGCLGPGIELNATAAEQVNSASGSEGRGASTSGSADSRPVQSEEKHSVPGNELNATAADLFSATLIDREEDCADSSKSAGGGSPVFQTIQNYPTQTKLVDEDSRSNFPRDIEYYQKSLHIARAAGDRAAEGKAYYYLGTINFIAKDIPEALNCFEKSLCLASEAGDRAGETLAHFCLGMVYFNCSDFEKAVKCFEESSNIAREAGDQAGVRRASHQIAESYLGLGNSVKDFQKAIECYEKGLNIAKKVGDQAAEANAFFNLGAAYYSLRDIPKAIDCSKESLLIAIEAGNRATEGKAYWNLGLIYNSQSNFSKAIECYEKSGNIAREAGDWFTEGKAYYHLGNVYESQSDLPKAVECYEKSLKIAREAGDRATVGKAYFSLGIVYQSLNNRPKAAEYYEKSLHIARESGDQYTERKSYLGLMSTSKSHEDFPIERFKESLNTAREAGDQAAEGKAYYDLGTINFIAKDIPEALNCFKKSLCLAREAGDQAGETTAHFCLGLVYFDCSDFEKAVKCFEESSNIAREVGDQAGIIRASHYITESYLGLNPVKEQANSATGSDERGTNLQLASTRHRTDRRPVQSERGCSVPGIELNATTADSRPVQWEEEQSVPKNELRTTAAAREAAVSSPAGATSQRIIEGRESLGLTMRALPDQASTTTH